MANVSQNLDTVVYIRRTPILFSKHKKRVAKKQSFTNNVVQFVFVFGVLCLIDKWV